MSSSSLGGLTEAWKVPGLRIGLPLASRAGVTGSVLTEVLTEHDK